MTIKIIDAQPEPVYRATCARCKSIFSYGTSDLFYNSLFFQGAAIGCPICRDHCKHSNSTAVATKEET